MARLTETNFLDAYSFELPRDRIAQEPAAERSASRLMVLPRGSGALDHASFSALPGLLRAGDLLVLNDTRVIPARVVLRRASGGRVSGLLLQVPSAPRFLAMLEGRGRLRAGDRLIVEGAGEVQLVEALGEGTWCVEAIDLRVRGALLAHGRMPLPPYIKREKEGDGRDALDRERYQTVFAREEGAVAAPTAGLHFTTELLERIRAGGVSVATVTLHVGAGTFLPVRAANLADHRMHPERFHVPTATVQAVDLARRRGGRVIAVGTTVVRTLESAAASGRLEPGAGETELFIRPPFSFRVVDAMITNFHLPESTLLMLVAAFVGRERLLDAYREAVERGYRFFSYGDAMLIA